MVFCVVRHWPSGAGLRVAQRKVPDFVCAGLSGQSLRSSASQDNAKAPLLSLTFHRPARSSRRLTVSNAWGDDVQWSPATIVKSRKAAKGHQTVVLEVGSKAAQKYTSPGQYLKVRLQGDKIGFFAIASSPQRSQEGQLELLVRQKGEVAELLCNSDEGSKIEASPVDGPGFRIEKAAPDVAPQMFLFATGSGISPVKALVESGNLQVDKRKKVKLFWGTHDPESTAYRDIIPDWQSAGVEVVPVYSSDGKGYVQDVFEKENEIQDGSTVGVILCGHKEMCQAITAQMEACGVSKERILLNF